jgi:predicted enzyme related to lactoylglutathione lyase
MAKVVGVGGVFFKSDDPEKLGAWYQKWLGVPVEPPYGASFRPGDAPPGGFTVWGPFRQQTEYFNPSRREFMFNLMVDDLDGALAQVREGGAEIVGEIMEEDYGRFGWFMDPDGNKVELWEPKEGR